MLKKLFMLVLCCIFTALPTMAQDDTEKIKYVALGDSIASGYALANPDTQSYPALLAAQYNMDYVNCGIPGMTTAELLEALQKKQFDIADADLITVSIGSNDLMHPVLEIIAGELDISLPNDDLNAAIIEKLVYLKNNESINSLLTRFVDIEDKLKAKQELYTICDNISQQTIPQIAAAIREQNPDAQLIFTNIYNPYKNMTAIIPVDAKSSLQRDAGAYCQPYIDRINKAFVSTDDYKVADLASVFQRPGYVNASLDMRNMDTFTFDPHPTRTGHAAIKTAVAALYVAPTPVDPDPKGEIVYGDVNYDGNIDASDASTVLQYVLNKAAVDFTENTVLRADVDATGEIDAADAANILQKALVSTFEFEADARKLAD